ncbi:MAG: Lrp/AsnC family transcriptional regulator [Lachnospiraceae bacterium]|nr:Lrp/AsnC family transcriptional regulator [Lachnospiraceae bacterium]
MREEILRIIEKNAKISIEDLAKLLGEDPVKVAEEIDAMEKESIICGYHTLINWEKTDKEQVVGMIEVRVTPQKEQGFDKIAESIYQHKEVKAVYLMSGAYDFTVILECASMRDVARFVSEKLSAMDSVLSTATHFVLKKYKDHGTVIVNRKSDERILVTP